MRIGEHQTLRVERETLHGIYLADEDGNEVLLPRGQCPPREEVGTTMDVFVYTDSEDWPVATRKRPLAVVGDFAMLRVVSEAAAGAFLDWGLDKDLFCPRREQLVWMHEGEIYLVRVYLDPVSNRVTCSSKFGRFLQSDGRELQPGQAVKLIVRGRYEGRLSVIIDGTYKGSLFQDEWHERLTVGDIRDGYIKSVRPDDGKIAVSLRPQGLKAVLGERDRVLEALNAAGGMLPVSDKSSPEQIQALFGLSKGAFKKLIGSLYKEGKIAIEAERIRLAGKRP